MFRNFFTGSDLAKLRIWQFLDSPAPAILHWQHSVVNVMKLNLFVTLARDKYAYINIYR